MLIACLGVLPEMIHTHVGHRILHGLFFFFSFKISKHIVGVLNWILQIYFVAERNLIYSKFWSHMKTEISCRTVLKIYQTIRNKNIAAASVRFTKSCMDSEPHGFPSRWIRMWTWTGRLRQLRCPLPAVGLILVCIYILF